MRDHRREALMLTFIGTISLLIGCGSKTYTMTFVMEPDNTASVDVEGDRPFVLVENRGPGSVELTFDQSVGSLGEPKMLTPGTSSGSTILDPQRVRLETGPDSRATVILEAQNATGLSASGPVPK